MKHFIYSRAQHKEQIDIAAKINKKFIPGTVYIRGGWKPYTEMVSVPNNRYSDASIILSTEDDTLSDIKFTVASFGER